MCFVFQLQVSLVWLWSEKRAVMETERCLCLFTWQALRFVLESHQMSKYTDLSCIVDVNYLTLIVFRFGMSQCRTCALAL